MQKTKLIIAEKSIAGRRIAELLSDSKITETRIKNATAFSFSKNQESFLVVPLRGHISGVDFPVKYSPWIGTDLKSLVQSNIQYIEKEKYIIQALGETAKKANEVIFATDYDREGESIALEAFRYISESNSAIKSRRAVFSAITKEDLEKAFSNLTSLDINLADSADARREIDLVWGAVLTRFLSIVSGRLGKEFLSAGRVQSPTLALIVDREKEILAFKPKPYWEIEALLEKDSTGFSALHKKGKFWEKEKALAVIEKKQPTGIVTSVTRREKTIKKPEPFNTTSFLRASTSLGFTAAQAMHIAEELYQMGYISYPRTDNSAYPASLNLRSILEKISHYSPISKQCKELLEKKFTPSRGKTTKDHPPIHPVSAPKNQLDKPKEKIYTLICRRFLATLHEDAVAETLSVEISIGGEPFIANGKRYLKLGWKEVYPYSSSEETILPKLSKDDIIKVKDLKMHSKETKPKPRYSQGKLIKVMSDLGLGTKSTRHEMIGKLYARNYIQGKKAIIPNKVAFAVIDALEKHHSDIVKPDMTAALEKEMDEIALGKKKKNTVVNDSRKMLLSAIEKLLAKKQEIGQSIRTAIREDKKHFECTDENCDGSLVTRKGRTGKRFLGCSNYPKCTTTYPLPQKGALQTLEEKCNVCGKPMVKIIHHRKAFKMCISLDCPSKDEWKKKKNNEKNKTEKTKNNYYGRKTGAQN